METQKLPPDWQNIDYLFNIVLVGEPGVGKTCFFTQFAKSRFNMVYEPTIGIDFSIKYIIIEESMVKLTVWDLSGLPQFRSLGQSYLRGARGVLLCYDVTNSISFENLDTHIKLIKDHSFYEPRIMLVGNKSDLEESRTVTKQEGLDFANKNNFLFMETSALDTTNIELAFLILAKKVYDQEKGSEKEKPFQNSSSKVEKEAKKFNCF